MPCKLYSYVARWLSANVGSRRIEHIEGLTQFTMAIIDEIRIKFDKRQYEFSKHAVDQSIIRDISVAELEDAIANKSEVIEDYLDDKYGASCLVLGKTKNNYPLGIKYGLMLENGISFPMPIFKWLANSE